MRRGVGVSSVQKSKKVSAAFATAGRNIEETRMAHVQETLEAFKVSLTSFAEQHKLKIQQDPEFRQQFYQMCDSIGVDPLVSTKSFWTDMGLDIGNYYYELGMAVIRECLQTRAINGGIIPIDELLKCLRASGGRAREKVSVDDVLRAVQKLSVLGTGIRVRQVGSVTYVVSVPNELSKDHETLIRLCSERGFVSRSQLLDWSQERFDSAAAFLLQEQIVWIDANNGKEPLYMMPSLVEARRRYAKSYYKLYRIMSKCGARD